MKQLDQELQAVVDDADFPLASLTALAMRGGEVVYTGAFGSRFIHPTDPAQNKPATVRTLYRVASISKLIVTLGVMRLVEAKKLDLDQDISDYLGFVCRNPFFADTPITTRMLLCHTSSLRDDGGYFWPERPGWTMQNVLGQTGKHWSDHAKPGDYFFYANLPWGVIATVMERVTGVRFDLLMQDLLLDPMQLEGGFAPALFPADQLDRLATLYRKRAVVDEDEVWNSNGPWVPQADDYSTQPPALQASKDYVIGSNGTLMGPQGGCRLTIEGLGKVMKMIYRRGIIDGRQMVCEECIEQMLTRQWTSKSVAGRPCDNGNDGGESEPDGTRAMNAWGLGNQQILDLTGNGIGDRVVEKGGFKPVGHFGDAYGLTSALLVDPVTGDGVAFIVGGVGADPSKHRGQYSAMRRYEERILTTLGSLALSSGVAK